jgi:hypothetical protein
MALNLPGHQRDYKHGDFGATARTPFIGREAVFDTNGLFLRGRGTGRALTVLI